MFACGLRVFFCRCDDLEQDLPQAIGIGMQNAHRSALFFEWKTILVGIPFRIKLQVDREHIAQSINRLRIELVPVVPLGLLDHAPTGCHGAVHQLLLAQNMRLLAGRQSCARTALDHGSGRGQAWSGHGANLAQCFGAFTNDLKHVGPTAQRLVE